MNRIPPVITIVNSAFQSSKCRFFAGITPRLRLGNNISAWGRLFNPDNSRINLFVDFFSIINFSNNPLSVNIFRNAIPPGEIFTSFDVGSGNFGSPEQPNGMIQFNPSVIGNPVGGTRLTARQVPANHTVTSLVNGNAILAPGTSFFFFLTSDEPVEAEVAFDWWENEEIF